MQKIEELAKFNKGLLKKKTIEECSEFIEALKEYEEFTPVSKKPVYRMMYNAKAIKIKKQKLLENVLHEIADCEVMRKQHEIHCTNFKLNDIIKEEKFMKYQQMFIENIEYINVVINWKIARTLLRNRVDYYNTGGTKNVKNDKK